MVKLVISAMGNPLGPILSKLMCKDYHMNKTIIAVCPSIKSIQKSLVIEMKIK